MAIPICFFQGLLSLIDVMLEIPMPAGWKEFRRPGDQACFVGRRQPAPVVSTHACHAGDWQALSELSPKLHLSERDVSGPAGMPWSGRGGLVRRRTSTTGHGPSGGKLKLLCPCAGARAWLPFKCSQRPCFLAGPQRSLAPGAKRLKSFTTEFQPNLIFARSATGAKRSALQRSGYFEEFRVSLRADNKLRFKKEINKI